LLAALIVLALSAAPSCGPGERTARETLLAYTAAVQDEDLDALYCLSAGAADALELGADEASRRTGFKRWARDWYRTYEETRETGQVDFGEHGIVLVKLFALGRGTFYTVSEIRLPAPDVMEVLTRLRFGYAGLDLSRLSPGTTFYLCGTPPGRVHPIVVEPYREVSLEVLDTLVLRWTLVRQPEGSDCGERWAVASVGPVEGTETSEQVTWVF
jgi:hypothetical protein